MSRYFVSPALGWHQLLVLGQQNLHRGEAQGLFRLDFQVSNSLLVQLQVFAWGTFASCVNTVQPQVSWLPQIPQ